MKECNILLTSLGNLGNRLSHQYYYFEEDGSKKYCDGISVGESGAKYIMSHNTMDEIVVIGSGATFNPGEEGLRIPLKKYSGYSANNINSLSEYGFFLYRLLQFQRGLDLEGIDVLEMIDPARKKEIVDSYEEFCNAYLMVHTEASKDKFFHYLSQDPNLAHNLYSHLPNMSEQEVMWLKRYIYTSLPSDLRLTSLDVNNELKISFIPSDRNEGAKFAAGDNIIKIMQALYKSDDTKVNLYVDMQGMESSAGYSIVAVLSMLSNDNNSNFVIKEIIASHHSKDYFANPIDNNEMSRYEINRLISGMDAFLKYGKVSLIENYWQNTGVKNDHIDNLMNAMRWVDDGVSLCNIEDLEYGISLLKEVFKEPYMGELPEFESNVFQVLERGIRLDYGALLDDGDLSCLELVKWAFRKKFYQQCLTIIESKVPNEIVNRGIVYYLETEEDKEEFLKAFNSEFYEKPVYMRWCFDDLSHYYIKMHARNKAKADRNGDKCRSYTQMRLNRMEDPTVEMAPSHSIIADHKDEIFDLLFAYYSIGNVRNSINHAEAGGNADKGTQNERMQLVIDAISSFISAYDRINKILDEKGLNDFQVKTVTNEEFKAYTNEHRVTGGFNRGRGGRGGGGNGGSRGGFNRGRGGFGGNRGGGGSGGAGGNSNSIVIPAPSLNPGEKLVINVELQSNGEIKTILDSTKEGDNKDDKREEEQ